MARCYFLRKSEDQWQRDFLGELGGLRGARVEDERSDLKAAKR